jgi:hypothetical protein
LEAAETASRWTTNDCAIGSNRERGTISLIVTNKIENAGMLELKSEGKRSKLAVIPVTLKGHDRTRRYRSVVVLLLVQFWFVFRTVIRHPIAFFLFVSGKRIDDVILAQIFNCCGGKCCNSLVTVR